MNTFFTLQSPFHKNQKNRNKVDIHSEVKGMRIHIFTAGKESFSFKLSSPFADPRCLSRRRLISTKSSSLANLKDMCVLENSSSSKKKKEVIQNTKNHAFTTYKMALKIIENSELHVSDYTKSRDKCLFLLYAMTNMSLNALREIKVKELNEIVKTEVEPNRLKMLDSAEWEKLVDPSKYNLSRDIKMLIEGKGENDYVLTEYRQKKALHRVTLSRRLNKVLDQVSEDLDVPKKELKFRTRDLSKVGRQSQN